MSARLGIWLLASTLGFAGCSSTSKNADESTGGTGGVAAAGSGASGGADAGNDASTGGGGGIGGCGSACTGPASCFAGKCEVTAFVACAGQACPPGLVQKMTGYAKACGKTDCPGAGDTKVCEHPEHAFGGVSVSCPTGYHEGLSVVLCGSPETTYSVCVED